MARFVLTLGVASLVLVGCRDEPSDAEVASLQARIAQECGQAGAADHDEVEVEFECAVPILAVDHVPTSIGYYTEILGFKVKWEWGDPPEFAAIERGKVTFFLCEQCQGQSGTWVSVFVDDVDTLYDDYVETGAKIKREPTDEPWGIREMQVQDLDGHVLRFGSTTKRR